MNPNARRIQFVCDGVLKAEVIVENDRIAMSVTAAYINAKYKKGLAAGGIMSSRADISRYWDVPVGTEVMK